MGRKWSILALKIATEPPIIGDLWFMISSQFPIWINVGYMVDTSTVQRYSELTWN
jgi:hypothetical protein